MKHTHGAIGAYDTVIEGEGLAASKRPFHRGADHRAILDVHTLEKSLVRGSELLRVEPVDPVERVRPLHLVLRDVPLPAPDLCELLCFGECAIVLLEGTAMSVELVRDVNRGDECDQHREAAVRNRSAPRFVGVDTAEPRG